MERIKVRILHIPHAALLSILLLATSGPVWPVSVTSDELSEVNRWVMATFQGRSDEKRAEGYLMVYTRCGSVEKEMIKDRHFRIVNKEYQRGLHFPSVGKVMVHVPGVAESFEAVVGMDSNDVNYYDSSLRGNAIASVEVGGREAFRSAVLREGMHGVPVKVERGDQPA